MGTRRVLTDELARLVGDEHVLTRAAARPYETDGTASRGLRGVPEAVVIPGSAAQVAAVVDWSSRRGVPLVPRGGGTGLAGGAVPVEGGVVVSLGRLTEIRDVRPERWRMTVGAGALTATVHRLARESGLRFPPDPGAAEQSQIGGNVATNAGGPHAFKYGATGAWVTGVEAVIPPGHVVSVGGEQRKDVGGYDIKSLLIGSEGTLGIITAVTLRLCPAPELLRPLVLFFGSVGDGAAAVSDIVGAGLEPAALDFLDDRVTPLMRRAYPGTVPEDARFSLITELDGSAAAVEHAEGELRDLVGNRVIAIDRPSPTELWRWRDGVSGAVSGVVGGKVSEDIVVPPHRLDEALAGITSIGESVGLPTCSWGHAGDGNIHASFLVNPDDPAALMRANKAADELFALAIALDGSVTGEHGIGYLKRGQLARQWNEHAIELHERIKDTFDPRGLLNPGKKLARLRA